jgi:hypothetical protein
LVARDPSYSERDPENFDADLDEDGTEQEDITDEEMA